MIAHKGRESRRGKHLKMARSMERLYKEGKCRDCSVVVTRMDFAKILGKFTKVKIQYESSTSPKSQKTATTSSPKTSARLRNNENGILKSNRKTNNKYQGNHQKSPKNEVSLPLRQSKNVLKENNVLKKTATTKGQGGIIRLPNRKEYAIIFSEPNCNSENDSKSGLSLADLLPKVDKSILPSEDWCINYFPNNEEPKEDKVYDRIAAELEDLMRNDKPLTKTDKSAGDKTIDEFPSIMDILNDNTTMINGEQKDQHSTLEFKSNLDSSDVEAMLLGKASTPEPTKEEVINSVEPMEINNTDELINDSVESNTGMVNNEDVSSSKSTEKGDAMEVDIPHSPSILDEALQKGIEEHLPTVEQHNNIAPSEENVKEIHDENENHVEKSQDLNEEENNTPEIKKEIQTEIKENGLPLINFKEITHVIFKKNLNGRCSKMVTCPRNMKYSIELEDKSVELLGAPKYISCLDDLQVLLQIVNESHLESLYVLH